MLSSGGSREEHNSLFPVAIAYSGPLAVSLILCLQTPQIFITRVFRSHNSPFLLFLPTLIKNIYLYILRDRERASKHRVGTEREEERESQIASTLSVQSVTWGSILPVVRSRPKLKSGV